MRRRSSIANATVMPWCRTVVVCTYFLSLYTLTRFLPSMPPPFREHRTGHHEVGRGREPPGPPARRRAHPGLEFAGKTAACPATSVEEPQNGNDREPGPRPAQGRLSRRPARADARHQLETGRRAGIPGAGKVARQQATYRVRISPRNTRSTNTRGRLLVTH